MVLDKRQKTRQHRASPKFKREPDISANGKFLVDPDPTTYEFKWAPYDGVAIINQSNSDLEVRFNDDQNDAIPVEANDTYQDTFPNISKFRRLSVVELSGSSVSGDDLKIVFYKSGTGADKLAQEQATKTPAEKLVNKFTGLM